MKANTFEDFYNIAGVETSWFLFQPAEVTATKPMFTGKGINPSLSDKVSVWSQKGGLQ